MFIMFRNSYNVERCGYYMVIEKKSIVFVFASAFVLFLVSYLYENSHQNIILYALPLESSVNNNTNGTSTNNVTSFQNVTGSNTTNVIPYVLNVTNSSDTTAQVVTQLIQSVSGGQSTSLQEVLDAASSGNPSSSSFEQVIDAASNALNSKRNNNGTNNTTNNGAVGLP